MSQSFDTKYNSLQETLSAIGKATFVRFYYDFKDASIPFDELAAKILRESPLAKSEKQGFRIPRARHIFALNMQIEALKVIIDSKKVDIEARNIAKEILLKEKNDIKKDKEFEEEKEFNEIVNKELIYSVPNMFEYDNTPKTRKENVAVKSVKYPRSRSVAKNALAFANYCCEVGENHLLFIRKNSNLYYTEPHHLIPLYAAEDFPDIDLDREQNVVSLCSHCHNLLHYGSNFEDILKPLFQKRKELLKKIGIDISYENLLKYYK